MHKHIGEENIAAVILEPIQGEGGFVVPAPGFLKGIADFCAANGIVFIADEIQSGMGRAGRWFADRGRGRRARPRHHREVARRRPADQRGDRPAEIMDACIVGGLGGTYGGNPVAAAAALAVLRQDRARRAPRALARRSARRSWRRFATRKGHASRDRRTCAARAMCAIELVSDRATKEPLGADADERDRRPVPRERRGHPDGRDVRQRGPLAPPLTIDEALLDEGLEVLDEAIGS